MIRKAALHIFWFRFLETSCSDFKRSHRQKDVEIPQNVRPQRQNRRLEAWTKCFYQIGNLLFTLLVPDHNAGYADLCTIFMCTAPSTSRWKKEKSKVPPITLKG
jgi:hypothetical protein